MSEVSLTELTTEPSKPVQRNNDAVVLPPFPEPGDDDFDDDIGDEEREYYKSKYKDLNIVKTERLHCSACDRHMGCSAKNESRMRSHPMLRTLMCHTCHTFYNSGEFEKGDDGSELYCRWCGQGGQVYCCSDCPHVFCAKCIKRNLGVEKIKEIESTDDWKCFKCKPRDLWGLRALCWALLRYCDQKNKLVYKTEDPSLKDIYQKDCAVDSSECCRDKRRRNINAVIGARNVKKETKDPDYKTTTSSIISKIPQGIQVKKFASINATKQEKKAMKRSISPKAKATIMKNPIAIQHQMPPQITMFNNFPTLAPKRMKHSSMVQPNPQNSFGFDKNHQFVQYTPRPRAKAPQQSNPYPIPVMPTFNGYRNVVMNDNINLSLESLTQGLDMAAVAAVNNNNIRNMNDELVCTPDFPLEPLCEVTEDNDDDVECITPVPVVAPKPPAIIKKANSLHALAPENIVQMTENDVTVNAVTGGLKFRVDPQTLSANKMYRLPDGRIFAINSNPNMPGGYSATIVAVTENNSVATPKSVPKGPTYAAKLCAVSSPKQNNTPPPLSKITRNSNGTTNKAQRRTTNVVKAKKVKGQPNNSQPRKLDMDVPVEWYRFNLIDAYDSLDYSLSRLRKLKKEATTTYLRSRSVDEMRALHKSLDRLLHNSVSRFNEVRDNLNTGMKDFITRKSGVEISDDDNNEDDDDDVEILNENDDPIFIDENSMESNDASKDNHEVDLVSSDLNDSGEKKAARKAAHDFSQSHASLRKTSDVENSEVSITKNCESANDKHKEISLSDDDVSVNKIDESVKDSKNDIDITQDMETDMHETQANQVKDSEPKSDLSESKVYEKENLGKCILQTEDDVKGDDKNDTTVCPNETMLNDTTINTKEHVRNNSTICSKVVEDNDKENSRVNEESVADKNDSEKQSDEQSDERALLKDSENPDKDISQENEISDELIETLLFAEDATMDNMHSTNSEPDSILP